MSKRIKTMNTAGESAVNYRRTVSRNKANAKPKVSKNVPRAKLDHTAKPVGQRQHSQKRVPDDGSLEGNQQESVGSGSRTTETHPSRTGIPCKFT